MGRIPCFFFLTLLELLGTNVENDLKIFNKVLGGMKKIFKKDNKITLLK